MSVATAFSDYQSLDTMDLTCINTMRTLAMDGVQAADSGHPGTPMAMAPVAYCLWQKFLRFDPQDPVWPNRDRFVLSMGHASMLLYSMLHLTEVKGVNAKYDKLDRPTVTLDDFNKPGFEMFDFDVYSLCGDGCMMEGVSSEAASLAGHLKLDNLCWIYDNNHITIEGKTDIAFTEDVAARFLAYGWNVLRVGDANDLDRIESALKTAAATPSRPSIVIVDSHIGYGSPHRQDTSTAHGEPLGEDEIKLVKQAYGWPPDAKFLVPSGVYEHLQSGIGHRGREAREQWEKQFTEYRKQFPELAAELDQIQKRELPLNWSKDIPVFPADSKGVSGRDASAKVLNAIAPNLPWLIGGSADLTPSTKTRLTFPSAGDFQADSRSGRNLHFGIREHSMGAILNGLALSKLRPFGSGFLIFSDYGRGAIRLSALMEIPVTHVFTHDSIGVGEDGPTHQPIEHLISLRAIPNLVVLRPCDANEVAEAWRTILAMPRQPVALILTRQNLPTFDRKRFAAASGLSKGAYVLADAEGGKPEVLLMATGSEVSLCVEAYEELTRQGVRARVVSMPSWELFERQS